MVGKEGDTDTKKIHTMLYIMSKTGEGNQLMSTFTDLTEENKENFNDVKARFTRQFKGARSKLACRAEFNRRTQQAGENMDTFITSLYALSLEEDCGYGALREEMIRDRIIVGVQDEALSNRLQLKYDSLTLQETIKLAKQSESVTRQKTILNVRPSSEVDQVGRSKTKGSKPGNNEKNTWAHQKPADRRNTNKCMRCGRKPGHPIWRCPAKDIKCHKCLKVGHFQTVCRSTGKVQEVEECLRESSSDSEDAFLGYVEANVDSVNSSGWMVDVAVAGSQTTSKWKIDTGADVSCYPAELHRPWMGKVKRSDRELYGAGGKSPIEVKGMVDTELKMGDNVTREKLYLVKNLKKPLLGTPAIEKLKIFKKMYGNTTVETVEPGNHPDRKLVKQKEQMEQTGTPRNHPQPKGKNKTVGQLSTKASVNLDVIGPLTKEKVKTLFPQLFTGLGKLPGEYKIQLKPEIQAFSLNTVHPQNTNTFDW